MAVAMIALAGVLPAAESVSWGAPANGLRLGLVLSGSSPDNTLQVIVQNVGPARQKIYAGFGLVHWFQYVATAPDGTQYSIVDRNLYVPASLSLPIIDLVAPGASKVYTFPLKQLISDPQKGPYRTLDTLLRAGCTVRASFDGNQKPNPDGFWTGHIAAGEVAPPQ